MNKVHDKIRALRKSKKMSQSKLARVSGISGDYMNRIELGKVKNIGLEKLNKIAEALNVSLVELLQTNGVPKEWNRLSPNQKELLIVLVSSEIDKSLVGFFNTWSCLTTRQRKMLYMIANELARSEK
jgi:transcriptional regulator with XRE-family HTH domain